MMKSGYKNMNRKKRLELNNICKKFKGMKGVTDWFIQDDFILYVYTNEYTYVATKIFGDFCFIDKYNKKGELIK